MRADGKIGKHFFFFLQEMIGGKMLHLFTISFLFCRTRQPGDFYAATTMIKCIVLYDRVCALLSYVGGNDTEYAGICRLYTVHDDVTTKTREMPERAVENSDFLKSPCEKPRVQATTI